MGDDWLDEVERRHRHKLVVELIAWVVIFCAVLVMCAGFAIAQETPLNPCQVAVRNVNAVRTKTAEVLVNAKLASAKRLASLTAREAAGFYTAMRTLIPVACPDKEAAAEIDQRLQADIEEMRDYAARNW